MTLIDLYDDEPDVIIAVKIVLAGNGSKLIYIFIFSTLPYIFFNLPITKLGKENRKIRREEMKRKEKKGKEEKTNGKCYLY
jgi:hypothetical protein